MPPFDEHRHPRAANGTFAHGGGGGLRAEMDKVRVKSRRRNGDAVEETRPAPTAGAKTPAAPQAPAGPKTPAVAPDRLGRGQHIRHGGDVHEVVHTSPVFGGKTRIYTINKTTGKSDQFEVDNTERLPTAAAPTAPAPTGRRHPSEQVRSRRRAGGPG